jgi:hypothetical protein
MLKTAGLVSPASASDVLIHDISEGGVLLESGAELAIGEIISIDLPHEVQAQATVVWTSGDLSGCTFDPKISKATISAALLKSPYSALPLDEPNQRVNSATYSDALEEYRLSPGAALVATVGLALLSWAIFGLIIAAIISYF